MPRNGSNVYSPPAGTTATTGTTIESAKYNAWVADVAADLNAARPIVAGGTGATTASGARVALGATTVGAAVFTATDAAAARTALAVPGLAVNNTFTGSNTFGPSQAVSGNDANNAVLTGSYYLTSGATNGPDSTLSWDLTVTEIGASPVVPPSAIMQTARALSGTDYMIIATRFRNAAGTWSEWRTSPVRDFSTYASTSGTTVEEIAIPIYARKISVLMENVGTASAAELIIRVRQSGVGVITSGIYNGGYVETAGSTASAAHNGVGTGFIISSSAAQANRSGRAVLERAPGTNKWFLNGTLSGSTNRVSTFSGSVGLAGALNGLRLQSNSAAFNAGEVTFTWET